jgi:hypothetical protein
MIAEFSQLNQDALFDLKKHSNNSSVLDTFYRLDSSNLEVIKAY